MHQLTVTPHPFTTQGQTSIAIMDSHDTLAALLVSQGIDSAWIVEVGGLEVPAIMWSRTKLKDGQVIECRPLVHNSGVLRTVALIYIASQAGPWGASLAASYGGSAAIYSAGIVLAGSLVVNKVLPPTLPVGMDVAQNQNLPTYSLSGGRNQARTWQPMSLILGETYCVPDLAAQSYTYFSGEDQYLKQTFNIGINCASVKTLRIGQTGIEDYQGVNTYYKGFSDIADTGLPVDSVDAISGGLLDAPDGTGPWVQRTTSIDTIQIGIDLEMNLFGVNSTTGAYESKSVELQAEYCIAGTNSWVAIPLGQAQPGTTYQEKYQSGTKTEIDYSTQNGDSGEYVTREVPVYSWRTVSYPSGKLVYSNATSKPLRVGVLLSVAANQYDIRIRKITKNDTASSSQNTTTWTQLKSFQQDTGDYSGQSLVSLNIKASGQLTGALDEFNLIATAKSMPYWDGFAWITATNTNNGLSNPGAQILMLARGIYSGSNLIAGLGWADSRIDIESLKAFMVWCASKNFKFDAHIQNAMSMADLFGAIAYAGLGTLSWDGGKLGVSWMEDTAPIEGVINMGNIKARTFSVSYAGSDRADEIEYGYFDKSQNNQWNSLRVKAPNVIIPQSTARLSNLGITSEYHAAVLARHSMGQNIYMAKSITFDQDLEYLTYKKGTVLALSHDVTQWGYGGRVLSSSLSGSTLTLNLDDVIPSTSQLGATSRFIGLRLLGEAQYRIFTVNAFTGSTDTISINGWPSGVDIPTVNSLWIYDFVATPGLKVVVTSIEPSGDGAKVTVSPVPNEFWPYVFNGTYTPPPNRSLLNILPVITFAYVSEFLKRQGNTFQTDLTVQIESNSNTALNQIWGSTGGAPLQLLGTTIANSFTWLGGLDDTWNLQIVPFNSIGNRGTPYNVNYTVIGLKKKPADVINFSVDKSILSWSPVKDIDLAGYKIKFNYGLNTWWNTAAELHNGLITESPFDLVTRPAGLVTLLIKAVDTTGNESENAAVITMNLGNALTDNIIFEWQHDPTWYADKTNATVISTELVANQTDLFYLEDEQPFYIDAGSQFYEGTNSLPMKYEFSVLPHTAGTLKLIYEFESSNYKIEYKRFNSSPFYGLNNDAFYLDDAGLFYEDDTGWQLWPGSLEVDTSFGEIFFRCSTQGGIGTDKFKKLKAVLDVPDINIILNDVSISSAGTRLTLGRTVNAIQNIQLTVQSDGNGGVTGRIVDKSASLGPLIQVLNASGTAVTGKIDAVIQAY